MAALTGKAAALCLLFFGSAFFFGGIALLSAGNAAASSADELSPTTDFETLGSVCEIVNVAHSAREDSRTESSRSGSRSSSRTSRTVYECYDDYTYTFRYDGELYTSKTNSRRRESDGTCADTTQLSPTFEAGSTVTCWQAVVEPIPSEYECGNAQCFKVFDPATDAESAAATALGMQIGGGVLLTIGLSLGGCAYYALRKAKQAAGGGGGTEMVSTSGTSGAYPSPAPAGGAYPSPAHVPVAGAYPPMAAPFGAAPAAAPAAPAGGGGTLRLHLAGAKGIRKGNNPKATFFVGGVKYETPICPGGGLTDVAWSEGMQNVTVTAQQLSTETVAVNVSASNGDNLASATFPLSSFGSGAPVDQWVAMDHGQLHVVGQLTGAATAPAAAPASVAGYGYPPAGAAAAPGGSYGVPPAAVGGGYPPAASMPTGYAPPTGYPAATAPGYPAAAAPAYAPQGYAPQGGGGL